MIESTLYLKAQKSLHNQDSSSSLGFNSSQAKYHSIRRCPLFAKPFFDFVESVVEENLKEAVAIDAKKTGLVIGSANSGNRFLYEQFAAFEKSGLKKISPSFVPYTIHNAVASQLAVHFGFQGVSSGVNCGESSGVEALADAIQYLQQDVADRVFCGAGETVLVGEGEYSEAVCLLLSKSPFLLSRKYKIKVASRGYGWLRDDEVLRAFLNEFAGVSLDSLRVFSAMNLLQVPFEKIEAFSSLPPLLYLSDEINFGRQAKVLTISSESHVNYLEVIEVE